MEDARIIDLYWQRSESAIEQTDRKYGRYCSKIAYNILYDLSDTEECVSDTWLHAWNAMPPQRPNVLSAFLGKITRNLAINRYERQTAQKRGGGQTELALEELSEVLGGGDVAEQVEAALLTESIDRFLGGLEPDARKVFMRRYWYMESVRDIAAGYGFSESKVKMLLLRTREKLRSHLQKEGYEI